jgi:hypothetical protein
MKKTIIALSTITLGMLLFANITINKTDPNSNSTTLMTFFTLTNANAESGGEGYYEAVLGCGSKDMSDWEAGCCAGMTSPCTDNCSKTEYCH